MGSSLRKNTKRLTLVIPEEVARNLQNMAEQNGVTLSSIVTTSIEYYKWLMDQKKDGFTIKAEKITDTSLLIIKEISII